MKREKEQAKRIKNSLIRTETRRGRHTAKYERSVKQTPEKDTDGGGDDRGDGGGGRAKSL